ncbi:GGDEF family protein [Vibrio ichthyoenteri ATCC 700023]|uniref:diguanylate cyclase n=1 Tax=Vibrio ichthyoenteri ATCC 700023 TaxID=870968 RepID=F9S8S2_9VIBR|nr:sensor domain-containing diguanylate cyclase [Vibrio ichthyoenteri]EGU29559.1 GGDEF family protein [Vibrio ichthyoenteri ATCC 700023]
MTLSLNKKWLYPLLVFIGTTLITLCVGYFSYQSQQRYSQTLFENLAERQTEVLAEFIGSDLDHIGAGANFFHATDRDEWNHFPIFAKQVIGASQTLVTLQWMERVEAQQVEQFIADARLEYPDYQIYTIPKGGDKIEGYVMPDGEAIFAAREIYPRNASNNSVLGFYSARPRFQLVVDNMRVHHKPSLSDKVRLIQDGLDHSLKRDGILVYHPVFDMQTNQRLIGVVIGVIRTSHYFDNLMVRTAAEQQLEVRVVDLGFDAEDDPVLFESAHWSTTDGLQVRKILHLPNRQWAVDFRLGDKVTANDLFIVHAIVFGGFVIACLLSYIAFFQVRAKSNLERQLDQRTKELQFLVEHDSLTGLYSRHAFNQFISVMVAEDRRFTLVGFDVDKFKSVNDNFGHTGGDNMLVHVARTVENCLEPGDTLIRLGGDEFSILSNVIEREKLQAYLTHIGETVFHSHIEISGQEVCCSLSIGAAIRQHESAEQLIHLADAQLYKSKNAGRNTTSIAE